MNSMTRLAFHIVVILMVTGSIVFHKSHSASAKDPTKFLYVVCVVVGDHMSMQDARNECDKGAQAGGCVASFIRPSETTTGTCAFADEWLCFGVNCPPLPTP